MNINSNQWNKITLRTTSQSQINCSLNLNELKISYSSQEIVSVAQEILQNSKSENIPKLKEYKLRLNVINERISNNEYNLSKKQLIDYGTWVHDVLNEINKNIIEKKINEIENDGFSSDDIKNISDLVENNKELLFNKMNNGESFFEILTSKCSTPLLLPLLKILLENPKELSENSRQIIKNYLFTPIISNFPFDYIMKKQGSDKIYDNLISIINEDEINENYLVKQRILSHAFSWSRYNQVFTQDEDISQELREKFDQAISNSRLTKSTQEKINRSSPHLNEWQEQRMVAGGSTTLKLNSKELEPAKKRWFTAQKYASSLAQAHRKSPPTSYVDLFAQLNRYLIDSEEGVLNAGITRDRTNKEVKIALWNEVFCHPSFLRKNLDQLEDWLKEEFIKCDKGEKNPIIFAMQAAERVVTLHPFEGGNGRTARLFMDYILERYEIAPCIVGNFYALFTLKPTKKNTEINSKNIILGLNKSCEILNKIK